MRIVLPWPDRRLSPNARLHWRAKSEAVKLARWDAAYAMLEAAGGSLSAIQDALKGGAPIPVTFTFCPPDNRGRDLDNMIASVKSAQDGIAQSLGVDDRRFEPTYKRGPAARPGKVVVEIPNLSTAENVAACLGNDSGTLKVVA